MTNPTLVTVPPCGTMLDVLAERYRAAFDKVKGGREQWIEGTLELAMVVAEAKQRLPDTTQFGVWVERNGLKTISKNDRSALNNFAKDLTTARIILEQSRSISWEQIWRDRPQKRVTESRNSQPRPVSRRTRRERRVPDVMRDDPPAPRKQLSEMFLTPEQVDPDFKGTPLEFTTKYGHVLLHTKDQIEQTKRQEALMTWIGTVADHAQTARAMLAALAAVDPATLAEWMSKPSKAEKLRRWCDSIQLACEAVSRLRPSQ
jgi:hypothetical protein